MIDSDKAAKACNDTLQTTFKSLEDTSMTLCNDIMEHFVAVMGDDLIERVDTFASDRGLAALKILLPAETAMLIHKRAKIWADLSKLVIEMDEVIENDAPTMSAEQLADDIMSGAILRRF